MAVDSLTSSVVMLTQHKSRRRPPGIHYEPSTNEVDLESSSNPNHDLPEPTPDVISRWWIQLKVQRSGLNVPACTEFIPLEDPNSCEACQVLFPIKQLGSRERLVAGKNNCIKTSKIPLNLLCGYGDIKMLLLIDTELWTLKVPLYKLMYEIVCLLKHCCY